MTVIEFQTEHEEFTDRDIGLNTFHSKVESCAVRLSPLSIVFSRLNSTLHLTPFTFFLYPFTFFLNQNFKIADRIRHTRMHIAELPVGLSNGNPRGLIHFTGQDLHPAHAAFAGPAQ